jgi:hypothetical protein
VLTRRQTAAALLAAPFLALLAGRRARGQAGAPPARRLLIFSSPNGTIHRHWRPSGGERDFAFPAGSILEPLTPWRDRLLVVDGLNFLTGNNHEGGQAAMLTNGGGLETPTRGASVDQYLARRIGAADRFPSLEFGVLTDIWGANIQTRIAYSEAGRLVHPEASPRRAFDRMFADAAGGADAAARLRALRRSVLDANRAEINDLHRRIGRSEQLKLEAHLDALRGVEQSLFSELSCGAPDAPDMLDPAANDNVPALLEAQTRLAVTALACGMTRVASVQLSHTVSPVVFSWAGNAEGHHSLSHAADEQAELVQQFVLAERWVAERFGALLGLLRDTPDPAGDGSLLDTTLVLWAKEMGDSRAHVCESVPFVLAGAVPDPGRYLQFGGASHARLLVSVCRLMGVEAETFGDPTTGAGGLAGVA